MKVYPNSTQDMVKSYNVKSGGVDLSRLQKLKDKEQPEDAAKVTISKEAQALSAALRGK